MKKIALLGMPNTGKSTFFNAISGASAKVANWAGVTVDIYSVKTLIAGKLTELIDLPGIYDLCGATDDEKIVEDFFNNNRVDEIYYILNATQIDRQLPFLNDILKLGYPVKIIANMIDETSKLGIKINFDNLEKITGCQIIPISAKYKQNIQAIHQENKSIYKQNKIGFDINKALKQLHYPKKINNHISKNIDKVLLNTHLGIPIFFLLLFLSFQIIYRIAEPIQDFIAKFFEMLNVNFLVPFFINTPSAIQSFLIDGIFLGLSTVVSFVPVIIIFFIVMAFVEDSGYLSRAAFVMDKFMEKVGLDGRGLVMILMGYGCNVPALIGTKIMREKNNRLLTMLSIPFSLCSARLQVFIFITAIFFTPKMAGLIIFLMYLLSFIIIIITALLFRKSNQNHEPIVIEIPPYRIPTLYNVLIRASNEIKHFIIRATKFIMIGVIAVWSLTNIYINPYSQVSMAQEIGNFLHPIFSPIGIDPQLVVALIFGFIAKEILIGALAVIYGANDTNLSFAIKDSINELQAISFMVFTLIYTPCLSTIATLKKETQSFVFAIKSLSWSICLAWLSSFIIFNFLKLFF